MSVTKEQLQSIPQTIEDVERWLYRQPHERELRSSDFNACLLAQYASDMTGESVGCGAMMFSAPEDGSVHLPLSPELYTLRVIFDAHLSGTSALAGSVEVHNALQHAKNITTVWRQAQEGDEHAS